MSDDQKPEDKLIENSKDRAIEDIEAKLLKPTAEEIALANEKKSTSPSICGEPQSIDDYLSAMLGIKK